MAGLIKSGLQEDVNEPDECVINAPTNDVPD